MAENVSRSPSCPGGALYYYPWLPYGLVLTSGGAYWPDGEGNNQCYYSSPANPFWSPSSPNYWPQWTPLLTLLGDALNAARTAGLTVEELDLENEIDLWDFPVQARLIYDNTTDTPVFQEIGAILANNSFNASVVTASVAAMSAADGNAGDCESIYGDPAMLLHLSELLAAVTGYDFGSTAGSVSAAEPYGGMWCYNPNGTNGSGNQLLPCGQYTGSAWTACVTSSMISTPVPQAVPGLLDIHPTPSCILNSASVCDETNGTAATAQADTFFSDFWALMQWRNLTGELAMFGELPNNQSGNCDGMYPTDAQWSVTGYLASSLYTNAASHTVLRPWENSVAQSPPCYVIPAPVGLPSGPYAP